MAQNVKTLSLFKRNHNWGKTIFGDLAKQKKTKRVSICVVCEKEMDFRPGLKYCIDHKPF